MGKLSDYQRFLIKRLHLTLDDVVLVKAEKGRLRTFDMDAFVMQALTGNPIRLTRETTIDIEPEQVEDALRALSEHKFVVHYIEPQPTPLAPQRGEERNGGK